MANPTKKYKEANAKARRLQTRMFWFNNALDEYAKIADFLDHIIGVGLLEFKISANVCDNEGNILEPVTIHDSDGIIKNLLEKELEHKRTCMGNLLEEVSKKKWNIART